MGGRRCLLVSKPLDLGIASATAEWVAIGNDTPVPTLIENFPFVQHWALCVVDCDEIDSSLPASRNIFLSAKYFDLSVSLQTCFTMMCSSRSYHDVFHRTNTWPEEYVKAISAVQDMGITEKSDEWILLRGWQMSRRWGEYRPLLWNCQQFALFLVQMAIDTTESANSVRLLLRTRQEKVWKVWVKRHFGGMGGMIAGSLIPGIGQAVAFGSWACIGIYMYTDDRKIKAIRRTYRELETSYQELGRLQWRMY